jgi:hypothetical protein
MCMPNALCSNAWPSLIVWVDMLFDFSPSYTFSVLNLKNLTDMNSNTIEFLITRYIKHMLSSSKKLAAVS